MASSKGANGGQVPSYAQQRRMDSVQVVDGMVRRGWEWARLLETGFVPQDERGLETIAQRAGVRVSFVRRCIALMLANRKGLLSWIGEGEGLLFDLVGAEIAAGTRGFDGELLARFSDHDDNGAAPGTPKGEEKTTLPQPPPSGRGHLKGGLG